MAISEKDYWKKPEESIDAYNTRIAALRGETPSSTSNTNQGTTVPTPTINNTYVNPTTGLTNEQMYNQTNDIVAQAKAMLKQTELQGEIPFTGSPFDNSKIISSYLTNNPITPTIPKTTTYATTTPTELGEETTKAQTYSEKLMELNKQLEGKTAEEIRLKEELGVNTQQSVVDDLNTQMEMLNNKASNIPLQLEREAAGRGLTSSQLSRQQARDLRDVAIEQLITSSSLSAAKNKLTDAKNKVTEAMNAKYEPILEQIETAKTNLDIILKSPKYTIEEKNRAQAQKDKEEAKKKAVKVAEEDEKNKLNLINSLYTHAKNMTPQQLSDLVLKLQDDKITYEQAQYIVAQSGVMVDKKTGTTAANQDVIQYYADQVSSGNLDLSNVPSETRNAVAQILYQATQPRDYADEEFRNLIRTGKSQNYTYEQIIQEIDSDNTIKNKDRAKLIAGELYGKSTTQQKTKQSRDAFSWFGDEIFDPLANFLFNKF